MTWRYLTLSLHLRITMIFPRMNKQHGGETQTSEAGTSCISWTALLCSHPGTLTFGFPAVSRPDLPQNLEWSGLCWQQASQWMRVLTLLALVQLQKLNHKPQRTELCEKFWETHNAWVSKPDSLFLPLSKAVQNDVLSVKLNRTLCYDCLLLPGYVKRGHVILACQEHGPTSHLSFSPSWHWGLQDVNLHVLVYKFYS